GERLHIILLRAARELPARRIGIRRARGRDRQHHVIRDEERGVAQLVRLRRHLEHDVGRREWTTAGKRETEFHRAASGARKPLKCPAHGRSPTPRLQSKVASFGAGAEAPALAGTRPVWYQYADVVLRRDRGRSR